MRANFSLEDKVAIVTGAGRGIGREIAIGFAEAGASVVITSRTQSQLEEVSARITELGRKALSIVSDVRNVNDINKVIKATLGFFGKIDILVCNAGISPSYKNVEDIEEWEWDKIMATNAKSVFLWCQAVGRQMIKQGGGSIINITSTDTRVGQPMVAIYCATKSAVDSFTKTMALEWAKHNIRVNAVGPGIVDTGLSKDALADLTFYESVVKKLVPMNRPGLPEEMVGAAIYLASDASSYVTGQTIFVDGGLLAQ